MNEELQRALAEMITSSVAVAGDALAFTEEQLPEVVQQLLVWKAAESAIWCIAAVALGIFGARLPWVKWFKACEEDCSGTGLFLALPFGALFGIALAMFDLAWLQIWLAPKVYLIEYAANLVK